MVTLRREDLARLLEQEGYLSTAGDVLNAATDEEAAATIRADWDRMIASHRYDDGIAAYAFGSLARYAGIPFGRLPPSTVPDDTED